MQRRDFHEPDSGGGTKTFILELLKPSHYDDNGYVIQWWRGSVPSNSLAALYAIALDAQQRQVLGSDVQMEVGVCDESAAGRFVAVVPTKGSGEDRDILVQNCSRGLPALLSDEVGGSPA